MDRERKIECLRCGSTGSKTITMEDRGLVSYTCHDCNANCFDSIREEKKND